MFTVGMLMPASWWSMTTRLLPTGSPVTAPLAGFGCSEFPPPRNGRSGSSNCHCRELGALIRYFTNRPVLLYNSLSSSRAGSHGSANST